jgi:hypothetical protein
MQAEVGRSRPCMPRAVPDRGRHKYDWLHCGMSRKLREPSRLEGVYPGIVPHIRTRAAMLAKLKGVDVRSRPVRIGGEHPPELSDGS